MGEDKQPEDPEKHFLHVYAVFVTSMTFLYIFAASFLDIPKENIRFVDTVLGFLLGTVISTLVQFYYGTSRGSQLKDAIISNIKRALNILDDKSIDEICKENKDKSIKEE